jgi:protein-arginine kinase activator protein McsA
MDDDMNDTRQMLCERCRKFVAVSTVRYVPKGDGSRMALCNKCLSLFKVEEAKKKQAASAASGSSGKHSFFCGRCRYKFKYSPSSRTELRCPYCGKADKILDNKETDAATLVKNADDF